MTAFVPASRFSADTRHQMIGCVLVWSPYVVTSTLGNTRAKVLCLSLSFSLFFRGGCAPPCPPLRSEALIAGREGLAILLAASPCFEFKRAFFFTSGISVNLGDPKSSALPGLRVFTIFPKQKH